MNFGILALSNRKFPRRHCSTALGIVMRHDVMVEAIGLDQYFQLLDSRAWVTGSNLEL